MSCELSFVFFVAFGLFSFKVCSCTAGVLFRLEASLFALFKIIKIDKTIVNKIIVINAILSQV